MQKQFYFLSPVEVVKVTSHNLEEVAEWCGGEVAQTESRRVPGRMDSYVWVPTPKNTNISWAFPGMFITKRLVVTVKGELRDTWAVFRRDYFDKNYFESPEKAVDETWEREVAEKAPKKAQVSTDVHVSDAMKKALAKAVARIEELDKRLDAAGVEPLDDFTVDVEGEEVTPTAVFSKPGKPLRKVEDVQLPETELDPVTRRPRSVEEEG